MRKTLTIIALAAAASTASATSLYEPFNYNVPDGTSLNGLTNTSQIPNQQWIAATPSGNTNDLQIESTLPSGNAPLSYSGLALPQGNSYGQLNPFVGYTFDRINFNASYGPGSTIYYSMLLQVPVGASAAHTGNSTFFAGLQWVGTGDNNSSYNANSVGGALCIQGTGTNDSSGNPQFALGIAYRDTATREYVSTPMNEGQTYFVVVGFNRGAGNSDDSANLYINPPANTFGQSDPGLSADESSSNLGFTYDYGYYTGGPNVGQYLGPLVSLILRNNPFDPGNINVKDVRADSSWAGVTAVEWTGSGNWGTGGNWTSGVTPSAVGADVTFGTNSANYNVNLDSPETVGTIRFNGTNSYTIGGAATLTLSEKIAPTVPADGSVYMADATSYGPASIQVTAGNHSITAPVMLASSTDFGVAPGASVQLSTVTASSGISLRAVGGGNTTLGLSGSTALQNLSSLSVADGSRLTLSNAHAVITSAAFAIDSTSTLDLGNNDLIVDYAPNSSNPAGTDTTTGPALIAAVQQAYDGGKWDLAGVTSTDAPGTATALAVVDNAALSSPLASVDGVTLDASAVAVKYTWYGDLNLDGVVNSDDLALMKDGNPGWAGGDLNYDGVVNGDDWALMAMGSALSGGANISAVPEPAVGALLVMALPLVSRRRRRQ